MTSNSESAPTGGNGAAGQPSSDEKQTILEMRQLAGLTAGSVMDLHRGSFQFRESDKEVGFSLVVDEVEEVSVIPGAAPASVDEIAVSQPTPLGAAVLNVGSACFSVRPPRPAPNAQAMVELLEAARRPSKAIQVPPFPETPEDGPAPTQTTSSRFGSLFSKQADENEVEHEQPLDARSWEFLESIRDARSLVAERHRYLHPNPEELRSRLERLDPGLWDRTVEHPLFARFAIAYSTIPWEPRFDDPESIPSSLHRPIQEMSCLPWVPITANLLFGPLGIVGSRSAALACARNAVLALACTTSPRDIEFSIVTAQGLVDDWNWTSSLPNSLFPNGKNSYCVAVADGMAHFDGAGFDHEAVKNNEMGLIALAETLEELPDYCATILIIGPDGQCQITNHLGERIGGTPIGVTAEFAGSASAIIRDAVGDDPVDEEQDPADGETAAGHTGPGAMPAPVAEAADIAGPADIAEPSDIAEPAADVAGPSDIAEPAADVAGSEGVNPLADRGEIPPLDDIVFEDPDDGARTRETPTKSPLEDLFSEQSATGAEEQSPAEASGPNDGQQQPAGDDEIDDDETMEASDPR